MQKHEIRGEYNVMGCLEIILFWQAEGIHVTSQTNKQNTNPFAHTQRKVMSPEHDRINR